MERLPAELLTSIVGSLEREEDFLRFWQAVEVNKNFKSKQVDILAEWLKTQEYPYLLLIELAWTSPISSLRVASQLLLKSRIENGLVKEELRTLNTRYITPDGVITYKVTIPAPGQRRSEFSFFNRKVLIGHKINKQGEFEEKIIQVIRNNEFVATKKETYHAGMLTKEEFYEYDQLIKEITYYPLGNEVIFIGYDPQVWAWLQTHNSLLDHPWEELTDRWKTVTGHTVESREVRVIDPLHLVIKEMEEFPNLEETLPIREPPHKEEYEEGGVTHTEWYENGMLIRELQVDENGNESYWYYTEENIPLAERYEELRDWLRQIEADNGPLHIESRAEYHPGLIPYVIKTIDLTYAEEIPVEVEDLEED